MKINKGMSVLLASMLVVGSMAKPIEAKPYDEYRFCCDNCGNLAYYDDGDYYDDKDNQICFDCAVGIWEDGGKTYHKTKLTVNDVYAGSKWVDGKTEPNATVKIYINGKKIKTDTALDNGEFGINKGINNVGEKIKIVTTKNGVSKSITKTMKASKFYSDSFEFNKVYDTDTKIIGKYWDTYDLMPKIEVYKGSKKIGTVKFDGNEWEGFTMSCKIPKQKKGTKLTIKVKGKGHKTLTMTTTVRSKYYTCKYGKKHYDTHACGCKYMTSSVRKNLKKYEVYNVKVKDIYGDIGCSGTFVNNTKTKWGYVEIMVKFYDKNGHVLCTNFTNTLDVAPNEKWNWKVLGYDTSKTSYVRITKITTSKY